MTNFESSVVIRRPIDQVFAFVTNQQNTLQWQNGLVDIKQTPASSIGVGTQVTEVRKFLGREMQGTLEVTEYEPNQRFTKKMTNGPFPLEYSYIVAPTSDGTRLTIQMHIKPDGFFAIAEPLVGNTLRKDLDVNLATLKSVLEQS